MSNKILIFNTESLIENNNVNKVVYSNLNKNNKTFYEMNLYSDTHKFINSTLEIILFQQILPYVTPIIKYIPELKNVSDNVTHDNFIYKTENNIECYVQDLQTKIIVSKFCYVNVIGIVLHKNLDKKSTFIYNYIINAYNTNDLVQSGVIDLKNTLIDQYYVFNKQVQFTHLLKQKLKSRECVYFGTQGKVILQILISAVQAAQWHYDHSNTILYKVLHTKALYLFKKNTPFVHITNTPVCDKIVNTLGKIISINLCYNNKHTIALNMYNRGYFIAYNKLLLTDNTNIYNELQHIIDINISNKQQAIAIYKKQLEMFKKGNIATTLNTTLSTANAQQLKKIESIYAQNLQRVNMPELEIVYALATAMNNDNKVDIKVNLNKLYTLGDLDKQTAYIKLNGINLICSHVIFKANLLLEDYKNNVDKNEKIRNALASKYYDPLLPGYFCKICGEKLIEANAEFNIQRNDGYSAVNEFDPFYTNIYREVMYITNNFINFGNIHTHSIISIIRNITDMLKNEMLTVHANLLKVKTLDNESIAVVLNIYIYIYTFAFTSHLILTNDFITFKRNIFTGGKQILVQPVKNLKDKVKNTITNVKRVQHILNTAISIVKKIKYKDIQESKIISLASVNSIFLKAYRFIANINYISITESNNSYWYVNNPIIDYLIQVYKTQMPLVQNYDDIFTAVMGRTHKKIEEQIRDKSIYATLVMPQKWSSNKYTNDSALSIYDYVSKNLCEYNVSDLDSQLQDFYKQYAYLHTLEKVIVTRLKLQKLNSTITLLRIPYVNTIQKSKFKICKCKNKTYIYKKLTVDNNFTKDEPLQLTLEQIKKWLEEKNYKNLQNFTQYKMVEIKCDCKINLQNASIVSFYKFYENKCPINNLHNFVITKSQTYCSKCNITLQDITTLNLTYYNKYLTTYNKIKSKEYESFKLIKKPIKIVKPIIFPKWENNIQNIQKLCYLLNIVPNVIYNIGLSENKIYTDTFTKTNLSLNITVDENIKQNNNLFGYYLFIIRNYYLLKNNKFVSDLPLYLREFFQKTGKLLTNKLPNINNDFLNKYKFYKKHLAPAKLTNFLTTSISSLLLEILVKFKNITTKVFSEMYVKMIFNMIIMIEKKLSKFDTRKIIKRVSNVTTELLQEAQYTRENDYDNNQDDAHDADADVVNDVDIDDNDELNNTFTEEQIDLFSIGDVDVENDDDTIYVDIQDRQN